MSCTLQFCHRGVLWEARTGEKRYYQSPAVGDGVVYLADDNLVYAFDAGDGSLRWKVEARVLSDSRMRVAGGMLYFADRSELRALDAETAMNCGEGI